MRRARATRFGGASGAVAIAGAFAACSLVTPLDGLSGGGDAGSPEAGGGAIDGRAPVVDASDGEASAGDDGSGSTGDASDAGIVADAGSDAGSPFCASLSPKPLFCDDFDENPLAALWDSVSHTGGVATLSGGIFESPPDVMLITTTLHNPSTDCAGYKGFSAQASKAGVYTLAFSIYVEKGDTASGSNVVLSAIQLHDPSGTWVLQLEVYYSALSPPNVQTLRFSENASPSDGGKNSYTEHPVAGGALPFGSWTRVQMVLTLKNPVGPVGGNSAALLFDGNPVVATETVNVSTVIGTPEIIVGIPFAAATAAGWTVRYDDVTFDAHR